MDFLRWPPSLRRAILHHPSTSNALRRWLTTVSNNYGLNLATTPPPASLLSLSSTTLNSYIISAPPEPLDLQKANTFFLRHEPSILFTATQFRSLPPSPFPEVAFLGRSNVGKSSVLNALFGRPTSKVARTSQNPGLTKTINGFGVGGEGMIGAKPQTRRNQPKPPVDPAWTRFGRGGLVVVDMPGYGAASRQEWGEEIMKYLVKRKQLRRTYVLVDAEHGLKKSDMMLLTQLRQEGVAHQVVLSKVDKLFNIGSKPPGPEKVDRKLRELREKCEEIRRVLNEATWRAGGRRDGVGDILCCSAEKRIDERSRKNCIGIQELRWSVLTACGLAEPFAANRQRVGDAKTDGQDGNDAGALMQYQAFS